MYAGFIEIMPVISAEWKDVSFNNLRAEVAVLVSAAKQNGKVSKINLTAEKQGEIVLRIDSGNFDLTLSKGGSKDSLQSIGKSLFKKVFKSLRLLYCITKTRFYISILSAFFLLLWRGFFLIR